MAEATPNSGTSTINNLVGVAAVAPNQAVAVGFSIGANGYHKTLAAIWNGTSWSLSAAPAAGAFHNDFKGISAVSANDVWAVGTYTVNPSNKAATFAERWNGTSWTLFRPPNGPGNAFSNLFGVSAIADNDVWAVGQYFGSTFTNRTLIEHWNGSSWTIVPSPNASDFNNQLLAVSAFSSTDAWAVGYYRAAAFPAPRRSLVEHWDGTSWTIVPGTPSDPGDTQINGVAAVAAGQAVAVGFGQQARTSPQVALQLDLSTIGPQRLFHVTSPGAGDADLLGVSAASGQVWAVGSWRTNNTSPHQTFVASAFYKSGFLPQLTGGSSDNPGTTKFGSVLYAVSAVSATGFWAAGTATTGVAAVDQTLAELWCRPHLALDAPASTLVDSQFSVTVAATNLDGSSASDYLGTVHFSSTDPQAGLPGDYPFAPADNGMQTFAGVQLEALSNQTITVTDTVEPEISGSATIDVGCFGACQAPAATPDGRGSSQGPTAAPSPRTSQSSGAALPAPRVAASGPVGSAVTPTHSAPRTVPRTTRSVPAGIARRRTSSSILAREPLSSMIPTARIAPSGPPPTPWYALLLLPLIAALALVARAFHLRR